MSNNINKNKDAYVYYSSENNTVNLFIYIKMTNKELEVALPLSFPIDLNESTDKYYIGAHFQDGKDYIGHMNINDIEKTINECNMIKLFGPEYESHFETINEHILNCSKFKYILLTKDEYQDYYDFAKEQLSPKIDKQ